MMISSLEEGSFNWTFVIIFLLSLVLFVWRSLTVEHPFLDIRILKTYDLRHPSDTEPITPFNSEFDSSQLRYIKEKLLRLGLLKSRNEEVSTKNQEHIIDYLQKFNKDLNSRKPKGVRLPNFKKIHLSDSYRITSLGGALLQLISEQCDLTDLNTSVDEGEEDFE